MAKAKKKVKAQISEAEKQERKHQEEQSKLWEQARAEVKPKKGPPSRLVVVPDNLLAEERTHWIRKLRIEQELLGQRINNAPNHEIADKWRDLMEQSYGDVARLRFRGDIWMAIGHLERLLGAYSLENDEELEKLKMQYSRVIAGLLNLVTGAREGLTTGHVFAECCPDCGEPVEVVL